MALAIHVIAHKKTDAVLAACTRGEGGTSDELVAELVGDKFPMTKAAPSTGTAQELVELGTFDADELVVEKVPGATEVTTGSVLDTPIGYVLVRDAHGAVQSLDLPVLPTFAISLAKLTLSFPTPLPTDGASGVVRLITSSGTVVDQPVFLKAPDPTHPNDGVVQLTAAAGTYTMVVLVKGYRPLIDTLTVS